MMRRQTAFYENIAKVEIIKGKKLWRDILEGKAWVKTQRTQFGEPLVTSASNGMVGSRFKPDTEGQN